MLSWRKFVLHCQSVGRNAIIICTAMYMFEHFRESISCLRNNAWWQIGIVFGVFRILAVALMYIYTYVRSNHEKKNAQIEEVVKDRFFDHNTEQDNIPCVDMKYEFQSDDPINPIDSPINSKQIINSVKITNIDDNFRNDNHENDTDCLNEKDEVRDISKACFSESLNRSIDDSSDHCFLVEEQKLDRVFVENKNTHEQVVEEMIEQSTVDWVIQEEGHLTLMNDNPLIVTDFKQSSRKNCNLKTNRKKPKIPNKTINQEKIVAEPQKPIEVKEVKEDYDSDVDIQSSMFQKDYCSFCTLQQIDAELVKETNELFNLITDIGGIDSPSKEALKNMSMIGSTSEGGMVCRIFEPTKKNKKELNIEIESNLEFRLLTIPVSHQYLVEDISGKPGFLHLLASREMIEFGSHVKWDNRKESGWYTELVDKSSEYGYLKTCKIKEVTLKETNLKENDKTFSHILALAFGVDPSRLLQTTSKANSESSIGYDVSIPIDSELKLNCCWDLSFVFQIDWWPTVASEFIERERQWPDKEQISALTKRGFIKSKPSKCENKDTFEFRYSFAHVEYDLVKLRSPHQDLVYLIFKSMIYKWIKPISPDHLHSYFGKTIMFWVCEKYPPDHPLWNPDETRTLLALNHLFNELLKAFKTGFLPYYFILEINVIPELTVGITQKVIGQIELILDDLVTYIPYTVKEVITTSKDLVKHVKSSCQILTKIKQKDYGGFLTGRPELIPKYLELYVNKTCSKDSNDVINKKADVAAN